MALTPMQKKLILQTVHCTKYLKATHGNYVLEHNEKDNNWYYLKDWNREQYAGKASINPNNWKHNLKYELKDKEFSGVVVKIENVLLSTTLGIYEKDTNDLDACDYAPSKNDGCSVMAATVFYRNGCKRIVPLDCIVEYEGYTNGKETEYILNNLEKLISIDTPIKDYFTNEDGNLESKLKYICPNKISEKDDGTVEIENTYFCINSETGELVQLKRYLTLNVRKRTSRVFADKDDEWFNITDDEYSKIMEIMNKQMKEECGFVPDLSYGVTNFDQLVNFANFPFAPELNEFSFLISNDEPGSYTEYLSSAKLEEKLRKNPSAVSEFIKLCGIPYTTRTNKIFLQGHRIFLEYLGIWYAGFRDETVIDRILASDEHRLFASTMKDVISFGSKLNDSGNSGLHFIDEPHLFYDISYLFRIFDTKTAGKFTISLINKKESYNTPDALDYLINLFIERLLPDNVIRKIGKEGFTEYNHDLLMRMYRDAHPKQHESFENQEISYTPEEKELNWENSGYTFCLPEDTNRLLDIGSKMNICVGHLYRDKAANKQCTIVYAKKADDYELCIELHKASNNRFRLIQKSAFSNHAPQGKLLEVFNQWCQVKGVC